MGLHEGAVPSNLPRNVAVGELPEESEERPEPNVVGLNEVACADLVHVIALDRRPTTPLACAGRAEGMYFCTVRAHEAHPVDAHVFHRLGRCSESARRASRASRSAGGASDKECHRYAQAAHAATL